MEKVLIYLMRNSENYTYEEQEYRRFIFYPKEPKEPKEKYITTDKFNYEDITSSKILTCKIEKNNKNIISKTGKTKYIAILRDIWETMTTVNIFQNTGFNIKIGNIKDECEDEDGDGGKCGYKGYEWNKKLGFSYQRKCSKDTFKEILKMCELNNYKIDMKIKLFNQNIINLKN